MTKVKKKIKIKTTYKDEAITQSKTKLKNKKEVFITE